MLKILAPAKVNLCLEILSKRDDGYHEIDTVMQAVSLFDEITVEDADTITLECSEDLGPVEDNLVYRAALLLRDSRAAGRGARITLVKNIPHGAGLGGGSSDAACALVALNRLWELELESAELCELAGQIGSDCAFFVEGGVARCTGRGEVVTAMPDLPALDFVLLYPEVVSPTGRVYAELSRGLTKASGDCYLVHVLDGAFDRAKLASAMHNRLEQAALSVSARLQEVWAATADEAGVLKRLISGSGSTIAFLMEQRDSAQALAESFESRGLGRAFQVTSLPRGAVWG